ncbi:MAG: hypothetical protein IJ618_03935 [Prevotella sp.]|nr:hypothetical protein [Prevotella sp.]
MKKFILSVFAFCLIPYIADFALSAIIQRSSHRETESWYDLMHSQIDADVVIMGNSRAWIQISPIILDSILGVETYNLGMDGSCANRQIHKYHLFRKYNRKPRMIIQNIDAWSLGYNTGYEKEQLYPYFWNWDMRNEFFESEPFTFWEKYVPVYRFRSFMPLRRGPKCLTKGYQGMEKPWDGSVFDKVKRITFTPNDTTIKMFDKYLAEAKSEGITVVLVFTPQYIGATRKTTNQDYMHEWYKRLANRYDFPVMDYTYMDISYDTAYFYNAMHLNRRGAEIFSDSLANAIKRLDGTSKKKSKEISKNNLK